MASQFANSGASSETKSEAYKTPSISELSSKLDKAVSEVKAKKETLDKALALVEKANSDYGIAVSEAQRIKMELNDELAKILP
jgi:predicted regulator of amino acid metabolism with ACT domain